MCQDSYVMCWGCFAVLEALGSSSIQDLLESWSPSLRLLLGDLPDLLAQSRGLRIAQSRSYVDTLGPKVSIIYMLGPSGSGDPSVIAELHVKQGCCEGRRRCKPRFEDASDFMLQLQTTLPDVQQLRLDVGTTY